MPDVGNPSLALLMNRGLIRTAPLQIVPANLFHVVRVRLLLRRKLRRKNRRQTSQTKKQRETLLAMSDTVCAHNAKEPSSGVVIYQPEFRYHAHRRTPFQNRTIRHAPQKPFDVNVEVASVPMNLPRLELSAPTSFSDKFFSELAWPSDGHSLLVNDGSVQSAILSNSGFRSYPGAQFQSLTSDSCALLARSLLILRFRPSHLPHYEVVRRWWHSRNQTINSPVLYPTSISIKRARPLRIAAYTCCSLKPPQTKYLEFSRDWSKKQMAHSQALTPGRPYFIK